MKYLFTKLLTLLFIGLKLTDHIDWSWWWVLSPMIITLVVGTAYNLIKDKAATLANDINSNK